MCSSVRQKRPADLVRSQPTALGVGATSRRSCRPSSRGLLVAPDEWYGVGVTLSVTSDSPLPTLLTLNGNGTAVTPGAYRGYFRLAVAPGGRHLLVQEARRVHPSGLGLSTIPHQQGDHHDPT